MSVINIQLKTFELKRGAVLQNPLVRFSIHTKNDKYVTMRIQNHNEDDEYTTILIKEFQSL